MSTMPERTVIIVDYGMGNLFSVKLACEYIGLNAIISSDHMELLKADGIILPGVGAFGDAMNNLKKMDLISPIKDYCCSGKPVMGVCLGMQLLMTDSQEFGHHEGLDIIKGNVIRFPDLNESGEKLKIPQVGWNRIYKPHYQIAPKWSDTPLGDLPDECFMYFVHSYYIIPENKAVVLSQTRYMNIEYCSSFQFHNIYACQFHPERSAADGISIYRNWATNLNKQ